MVDVHTREARSRNMRAIKSKDTRPELLLRKALHARGFRYRLGGAGLPGRPDLVLPKYKSAIFVNGCFWHGHDGCRYFKIPATRTDFWMEKIGGNKRRDIQTIEKLKAAGWNVFVVWECSMKPSGVGVQTVVDSLAQELNGSCDKSSLY